MTDSTQTPLERAARALCRAQGYDPDQNNGPENDPHPQWWFYIDDVRAVLMAIREPSEAMVEAGGFGAPWPNSYPTWQAMIDTALGE